MNNRTYVICDDLNDNTPLTKEQKANMLKWYDIILTHKNNEEFCKHCHKRIRLQGNGILEPLCKCKISNT